jgi:signal transduction protein with GAF and PtsI domain
MFGLTRQSRMEKVKDVLGEAVSYTDDVMHDRRLRSSIRSAVDNGVAARDRVRNDVGAARMTSRLLTDKKLRKNLRELIDDIDRVGERMRRRRSHRVRNAMLIVAGTGAAVAVVSPARRWVAGQITASENGGPPAAI